MNKLIKRIIEEFDEELTKYIIILSRYTVGSNKKEFRKAEKNLQDFILQVFQKGRESAKEFTKSELAVIAMDFKGLLDVNKIMRTSISGNSEIAQNMVNTEIVRQQIFEKVKDYFPKTKEDLLKIKPL